MHSRLVNLRLRSAVLLIAVGTTVVVLGSALMMTLLDRREFAGFDEAMWWSLQTVTTVGYGDIVPTSARGQMIAGAVMLLGIAASSVLTAFVASALFEGALSRRGEKEKLAVGDRLEAIERQLADLLRETREGGGNPG